MAEEEPRPGVAQVLPQVEPIDDLHRLWGAVPNPLGVQPTPLPADDRTAGMHLQPLRNGQGRALGEPIKHVIALESPDDRPTASPAPPGPCIKPDHPWGRKAWEGRPVHQTQDRPITPREA
jgi:hypothetical protein